MKTKIGVFDSGVGGQSVANAIRHAIPDAEIVLADDKANVPYGNKTKERLIELVTPKLKELQSQGCDAIVIACNTVTTTIIKELRDDLDIPLVGMEPMIKPAAEMSKSGVIGVCATPATLASERYKYLKNTFAKDKKVIEPDCSDWSSMIEHNKVDEQKISKITDEMCDKKADVIVLGCTHYHWIEDLIRQQAGNRAKVIQPIEPVISQLRRVLEQPA